MSSVAARSSGPAGLCTRGLALLLLDTRLIKLVSSVGTVLSNVTLPSPDVTATPALPAASKKLML